MKSDIDELKLHDYKPLRDIVFESLKQAIIKGQLKPGERLMEVQLAEKLGVSRTPVREAIRKLELEGLLIMVPRKGAYVSDVSIKDIIDVLEVRASLEGLAAFLAAERMTDKELIVLKEKAKEFIDALEVKNVEMMIEKDAEFHEFLFKITKNEKLMMIADSLSKQLQRFRAIYMNEYDNFEHIIHEHKNIIESLINRDSEKASKYAQQHIEHLKNYLVNQLSEE